MTEQNQIKTFVERVERLEEEIKALNGDKRDIYAEAKGRELNVKILKAVVAHRRKDPSDVAEHDALFTEYLAACGTAVATRAHAHATTAVSNLDIPDYLRRGRIAS